MQEAKPLRAVVRRGDKILVPCGRAEDETGTIVRVIYDEMLITEGTCQIEYDGMLHIRIRRKKESCILDDNRDN